MIQTIIALVIFLFPLAYSPGPGNMFFAANGARFGFRSTVAANTGYHIATWTVTMAIGLGFIAAFDRSSLLMGWLKIAGSMYVIWIAWALFKADTAEGLIEAKPATFIDGVILLILNPKAYVIITLMFTQFLNVLETDRPVSVLLISTIFTINNLLAFSIWILIGDKLATYFRTPKSAQKLNRVFAGILVSIAIWILLA